MDLWKLKMFGKNPRETGKDIMLSKLHLDFFVLLFHFHQFQYATNTFGKSYFKGTHMQII